MSRLFVPLQRREFEALYKLAAKELRDPRDQAAVIVRDELVRCGMLPQAKQTGGEPLVESWAKAYQP